MSALAPSTLSPYVCLGPREHERQLIVVVEAAASSAVAPVPPPVPSHPGAVSRTHQEPAASQSPLRPERNVLLCQDRMGGAVGVH